MTFTAHTFPQLQVQLATKALNLETDSFFVMLGNLAGNPGVSLATAGIGSVVTPTQWKAIVPEITGTEYTAGGVELTSPSLVAAGTDDTVTTWTATIPSPTWGTASTITANQAMFYSSTSSVCVAFWDFGGAVSSVNGNFTLTVSTSPAGIAIITTN
jgi:hypothetical protein